MTEPNARDDFSALIAAARRAVQDEWAAVDDIERHNFRRVLAAFQAERVGEEHFAGSTGRSQDTGGPGGASPRAPSRNATSPDAVVRARR